MMEMQLENPADGKKGEMAVTKINKQIKSIETNSYPFMNPD